MWRRGLCPVAGNLLRFSLCLLLFSVCGCQSEPGTSDATPSPVPPVVLSWDDQLAAVRAGEITEIATESPIRASQFAELSQGCEELLSLKIVVAESVTTDAADAPTVEMFDWEKLLQLPRLNRLVIVGPVDDTAMEVIAQITTLTALNLPTADFSDQGLGAITRLANLKQLRFGSPHVTDSGVKSIASMTSLRALHLIGVPLTDAGLEELAGMSKLQSFYLDGGSCTDDGLSKLIKKLPQLHLHVDQLHLPDDPQSHNHGTVH